MVRALACIGFAALLSSALSAQSTETPPKFLSVDIRASGPNTIPEMRRQFYRGRYELLNATLVDLICAAWGVDADDVAGGPDWLDVDRFDVIATAPAGSTDDTLKTMLRGLLADHFQLVTHKGTKDVPAYVITAGKKLQLKQADGSESTGCSIQPSAPAEPVLFVCSNMTMAALAAQLPTVREASGYMFNYPVVDRTALKGAWNFSVKWTPRAAFRRDPAPGETTTIFDAFQKQLGLNLELSRISTPVIVVDHVNQKPAGSASGVTETPAALPQFEVASIKPYADFFDGSRVNIQPGGRVTVTMTLLGLIQEAWDITPDWIIGRPKSIGGPPFVVTAKAPPQNGAKEGWDGPVWNGVDIDSMRMMLRALLMDRFRLAVHFENRIVPGYALVAAKPKLRKADPSNRPGCREGPGADGKDPRLANPIASRLLTCRNMTIAQFAAAMNKDLFRFRPLTDSTGIAGRYDFTINFSPTRVSSDVAVPTPGGDASASEPDGTISLSEAFSRQLGLKLESRKVSAPVLVIDHVDEMPSGN